MPWTDQDRLIAEKLDHILDVPVTFSRHCRSGLLAICQCWRCRKTRGEPVTPETEAEAEAQAKVADIVAAERFEALCRAESVSPGE